MVFTDHKSLFGALHRRFVPVSARQQRHLSYIAKFTPTICHINSESNIVVDILSRRANSCSAPSPPRQPAVGCVVTCSGPGTADKRQTEVKGPFGPSVPPGLPLPGHLLLHLQWIWRPVILPGLPSCRHLICPLRVRGYRY